MQIQLKQGVRCGLQRLRIPDLAEHTSVKQGRQQSPAEVRTEAPTCQGGRGTLGAAQGAESSAARPRLLTLSLKKIKKTVDQIQTREGLACLKFVSLFIHLFINVY